MSSYAGTVTNATLTLTLQSKSNGGHTDWIPDVALHAVDLTSPGEVTADDYYYTHWPWGALSNVVDYSDLPSPGNDATFTFSAEGLEWVNTQMGAELDVGIRNHNYDASDFPPTWHSSENGETMTVRFYGHNSAHEPTLSLEGTGGSFGGTASVVLDGVSSGYYSAATLSLHSGTLTFTLGTNSDSTAAGGAVPDTLGDFVIMGDAVSYMTSFSENVNGSEVLHYEPNEIIWPGSYGELEGGLLPDRTDNGNDGLIVFGANPAGSSISLGAFTPGSTATYTGSGDTSQGELVTDNPLMPPTMYTELDTSKVPGGSIIDALLGVSNTPKALWWFPFTFLGICWAAMILYNVMQSTGGEGSLFTMAMVMEVLLVFFGIVGSLVGGIQGSLIPLWPAFLFPIPSAALVVSRRHSGW